MKLVFRADSGCAIGGGHVMRCLSLATAALRAGHDVVFVTADVDGALVSNIRDAGVTVAVLPVPGQTDHGMSVEDWRPLALADDIRASLQHCRDADWLVLDHYGLGGAWVLGIRAAMPDVRVLALDDLDREPLFADILLDPAHVTGTRAQPRLAALTGPSFALLRPEFSALRDTALAKSTGNRLLVLPGMLDRAGLAPAALEALRDRDDLDVDVIMSRDSQSCAATRALVAQRDNWTLHLNVTDMAARMAAADYCIGAGGGTAWERCCLGLPTVAIAVSENQEPGVQALVQAGAAIGLGPEAIAKPSRITRAVDQMIRNRAAMSTSAAALCDGHGASRVLSALTGTLRPVRPDDAQLLFDWRDQPRIRNASLDPSPLDWTKHLAFVDRITTGKIPGLWFIYAEDEAPLGHVNARDQGDGSWLWSFYIGAPDAPAGAGTRMLTAFLRHMLRSTTFTEIHAQVVGSNAKSARIHTTLGFTCVSPANSDTLDFRLKRRDVEQRFGLPQHQVSHDD